MRHHRTTRTGAVVAENLQTTGNYRLVHEDSSHWAASPVQTARYSRSHADFVAYGESAPVSWVRIQLHVGSMS